MAALSTLAPLADRAMKNAGTDFTALRQIHIGRLELEVVGATRPFKRNWERVDSVGNASSPPASFAGAWCRWKIM